MERKTLQTEKGAVAYWRSEAWDPARDTLFFLHGLTAGHRMFAAQTEHFGRDHNVLVWDAPAHGCSRPFAPFDFADAAGYMRRILDECGVGAAVLIGQSLGGYFAQSFIKRYPERVKAFVAIGSSPYGHGYYSKSDLWLVKQVEWMAELYPFSWMKRAMARQVPTTQAAYDNMTQMLAPYGKRELCHLMGLGYAGFLEDNCDLELPCPTLLLVGEKDRTGKVAQYNRAWAKRTGLPLEIIAGAAHNANVDRPDEVNARIRAWLEAQR